MTKPCVFCDEALIQSSEPIERATVYGIHVRVFTPLFPVTPGHTLIAPVRHVADATTDPLVAAACMGAAARVAQRFDSANIITSIGAPATQTVAHLHLHVVPRSPGDGLTLPWDSGTTEVVDPKATDWR